MSKLKGSLFGLFGGSAITIAVITNFLKGVFTRAFTYYYWDDLLLVGGILSLGFATMLIIKDRFDGGGFNRNEKQRAAKATLSFAGLLKVPEVVSSS